MQEVSFEQALEQIQARDPRYSRNAYLFVREALDFTQKAALKAPRSEARNEVEPMEKPPIRHVTGQELLAGIREYALQQFGPMVPTLLEEWGIRHCADFGEIVFNMVEIGLLAKTKHDSRADFKEGYDFDEAFRKPFLPSGKMPASKSPRPTAE